MTSQIKKRRAEECVSVSLAELLLLSKNANKLSLSTIPVQNRSAGIHLSRQFGRGMEFAECRRYHEGDDIRSIDWRVTARTGKVHTKLFSAEKERQVLLCTDMRSSMFFGTQGVFKSVQAALITASLAWSAVQGGNRLGGIIFDDAKQQEFRPMLGKRGVLPLLQHVADASQNGLKNSISPENPASLDQAIQSIKRVASHGSMVFVISDFRKLTETSKSVLIQLSAHCDLFLFFLYDTLETALPKNGHYPVSDGKNDLQLNTYDKSLLKKYHQQFVERRETIVALGKLRHICFLECSTENDYTQFLNEHFKVRAYA